MDLEGPNNVVLLIHLTSRSTCNNLKAEHCGILPIPGRIPGKFYVSWVVDTKDLVVSWNFHDVILWWINLLLNNVLSIKCACDSLFESLGPLQYNMEHRLASIVMHDICLLVCSTGSECAFFGPFCKD